MRFRGAGRRREGGAREANGADQSRPTLYCIVPRELAGELHDPLRAHFHDDPSVVVVVESRLGERRTTDRRAESAESPDPDDRRRVRNTAGRRIGDRRAAVMAIEPPPLPGLAQRHLGALIFVERIEPTTQRQQDLETARLVARAQAGDKDAMPELYLRHFDGVYTYLRVALRDQHEAEDAAQDVFIKAMQALPRYELRPGVPFRAWLFRIARNEVLSRLRRSSRVEIEAPETVDRRRAGTTDHDVAAALSWVSNADLMFLLERLPVAQRQVITLRYMLDLEIEEMATVLGRTAEAIRQIDYRARRSLEERLLAIRGRHETSSERTPMLIRVRPASVLRGRRFALTGGCTPPLAQRARAW